MINSYLKSIKKLREKLELIKNKFLMSQIPIKLHEAFKFIEEYISLQIENWVTRSIKIFEIEINQEIKNQMIAIIKKEQQYRKNLKSP